MADSTTPKSRNKFGDVQSETPPARIVGLGSGSGGKISVGSGNKRSASSDSGVRAAVASKVKSVRKNLNQALKVNSASVTPTDNKLHCYSASGGAKENYDVEVENYGDKKSNADIFTEDKNRKQKANAQTSANSTTVRNKQNYDDGVNKDKIKDGDDKGGKDKANPNALPGGGGKDNRIGGKDNKLSSGAVRDKKPLSGGVSRLRASFRGDKTAKERRRPAALSSPPVYFPPDG